jgi:catechol 2,3-dioxygenase-like lactoylglutathione lyase family enzyme
MKRHFANLFVDDPPTVAAFYQEHLGLVAEFRSDWFIHLQGPGDLELGILRRPTELLPATPGAGPPNVMLTFVVEDVDAWAERARAAGVHLEQPPTDRFYGQRVALVRDPAGTWVDVSSPCDPDPEWASGLEATPEGWREIPKGGASG